MINSHTLYYKYERYLIFQLPSWENVYSLSKIVNTSLFVPVRFYQEEAPLLIFYSLIQYDFLVCVGASFVIRISETTTPFSLFYQILAQFPGISSIDSAGKLIAVQYKINCCIARMVGISCTIFGPTVF